jgi:hypothetical protein
MHTHRTLANSGRATLLVLACGLLYISMLTASPRDLAGGVSRMLATTSVGLSAAVMQNADNTLAAQLAAREAELAAREAALEGARPTEGTDPMALYSFALSIALFSLLLLNFYFDWARARRNGHGTTSAALHAIYLR